MESLQDKKFGISSWAIDNRMTVYVIIAIIFLGGLISYYNMPREAFPEIIETKIYVSSINPGNAAEDVEKFITKPLEEEFNNVSGVNKITSSTFQDYSLIIAEFDENISVEDAKQKIKDKVDLVKAESEWPTMDGGAKVEPTIFDLNISEEQPILNVNLSGDFPISELKNYAEYLQDELERLPQIKEVAIRGAQDLEIEVAIDLYKMTAAQVGFDDVINAVNRENRTISGGNLLSNGIRKTIRVQGEIEQASDLENVVVKKNDGVVYLKDIADIKFQEKEKTTFSREFGHPVVMLDVKKRGGQNMIEAISGVRNIVAEAQKNYLPSTLNISYSNDQSVKTINQVDDLVNNIIFGVILVVGVLMFFLGLRNALFVGIAIPLSMFMSYMILASFGITLNTMVLFALVMGLGMLVDNGIVVVENVYSLMDQGMSRIEAAKQGVGEIAWPIIASTATTLAAFFPLGLWPGTMGKFMIYFPMTLSVVLFSSLFVALIINAMLTSTFMKLEESHITRKRLIRNSLFLFVTGLLFCAVGWIKDIPFVRGISNLLIFFSLMMWVYKYGLSPAQKYFQNIILVKLENMYERGLRFALRKRNAYYFFFGTLGMLVLSFALLGIVQPKVDFFPDNEPNQVIVYIEFPEGTDIGKTNSFTQEVEEKVFQTIKKYEDADGYNYMVESAVAQVGEGSGNPQTDGGSQAEMPHRAKITLSMREFKFRRGKSSSQLLSEIREAVKGSPGVSIIVEKDPVGPPAGYPVNIELAGEDYEKVLREAVLLKDFINAKNVSGLEEIKIDINRAKPSLNVIVDRKKAGELGVTTGQLGSTLRRAVFGEKASTFKDLEDDYEINVRVRKDQRYNENLIFNQPVTFRDQASGQLKQIPISVLVDKESSTTFNAIKRKNLKRIITVYSNVLEGYNANEIVGRLKTELKEYKIPANMTLSFTGEQEEQAKNLNFLIKALLLAVGGILLILVGQFNSISNPLIILTAVILSFIGVFMGLIVFQMDFIIIMTMMGIISLAGIVVNNAIVLIDYTNLLAERKRKTLHMPANCLLSREQYFDIIVAGGKSRLRPVLLTAITTVLGLIPLAIGLNIDFFSLFINYDPRIYIGGDNVIFWGPLAWTVIFGLTFATFLTLVIVPVMYYLVNRAKIKFKNRFGSSD
ncbi:MAG: efflux RND transporter permease subunit [Flavobacteriaceae bacterium]|nr:efflux RND transporter permease subunit [Flavobacteriaceae bacterium]